MNYFITLLIFVSLSISAKAEDFNVLWEKDFSPSATTIQVSDDGKYFYVSDDGFLNFYDSETGMFLHKIILGELNLQYEGFFYLNNDRVVLPYSLDSILIYNISTKETEETIDLDYNTKSPNYYRTTISPNKRYLSMYCILDDGIHIIIVDLEQKRLYKDVKLISMIGQLYSTNDPNRMIITDSDQFGTKLMEIRIDGSPPFGYKRNIFEEVDSEGEIRGQKYDADEDAFYYLSLPYGSNHKLIQYNLQSNKKTELYIQDQMSNRQIWFNDNNEIILYEVGVLHNYKANRYLRLRSFEDNLQNSASSCNGFETILIREYTSLLEHKLRRLDVNDFLTDVEIDNPINNFLYPNPTTGLLNISLTNQFPSFFNYSIISVSGQILISNGIGFLQPNQNNLNINVGSIPIGHYTLRIFSDQEEFIFNLIKE